MVETIKFGKIYLEDLATGSGTDVVTLADGSVVSLTKINLTQLGAVNYLDLIEQGSSPATPASGMARIYRKSDNKQYLLDDLGVEKEWPFTLGTVESGIWQGTAITPGYGGTGLTSFTIGDLIVASGATTLSKIAAVASGQILKSQGAGALPAWTDSLYISSGGNVGIGTTAPGARLESLATTEQLRLSYDATHYTSFTADSGGNLTIASINGNGQNSQGITVNTGQSGSTFDYTAGTFNSYSWRGGGAYANVVRGIKATANVVSSNTQNWTDTAGLRGVDSGIVIPAGITGTITGAANFYANATVGSGTITNLYGVYVAAPTGAGTITNKYAFVSEANAGNVGIGTASQINERLTLANASWLGSVNAAGTGSQKIIALNANNLIAFGAARTAAATPANFSAAYYIRFQDVNGAEFYVPAANAAW